MSPAGTNASAYRWLRDGLIPGQSALLETLWVWPWTSLVLASNSGTQAHRFAMPFLLVLVGVPALAGRWLESRSWPALGRRAALLAICVVLLLTFMKTETLAGEPLFDWRWLRDAILPWTSEEAAGRLGLVTFGWFVAGLLLARGCWLALGEVLPESADRWFLGGLAAFVALLVLIAGPGMLPGSFRADQAWLGPLLSAYFLLGLGWVGLVRQQHLAEEAFRRDADQVSLSWLLVFSTISGAMLVIAAAVAAVNGALTTVEFLAFAAGEAVWQALTSAWNWLAAILGSLFHGTPPATTPGPRPHMSPTPPPPLFHLPNWHLPPLPFTIALPTGLLVLALLIALSVWVLLRYQRWNPRLEADEEERTSVWSWGLLWQSLRQIPARLLARLRGRRQAGPAASPAAPIRVEPAPASLRSLYRAVLRWSAERGRSRAANRTPHEFEPDLAGVLPEDLARDLTATYVRLRYGGAAPPQAELDGLRERWDDVRGT